MVQQGQVFKLRTRSADGKAVWAYRHRFDGRGSARPQAAASRVERGRGARLQRRSSGSVPVGERRH